MLIKSLLIISFLSLSNAPTENYNESFIGIWAEFNSGEAIQVFRGGNEDIYFERFLDNVLVASGQMYAGELELQLIGQILTLNINLSILFQLTNRFYL